MAQSAPTATPAAANPTSAIPTPVEPTPAAPEAAETKPGAESTTTSPATATPVDPQPAKPALWADLLKNSSQKAAAPAPLQPKAAGPVNGLYASLESALRSFQIQDNAITMPFLEPRGLVNTGNMCFMNAVSYSGYV